MDRALYLVMYGAKQALQSMQMTNNNLANVTKTGFRADLAHYTSLPVNGNLPTRTYNQLSSAGADLNQGPLISTGRSLDVAVKGNGWISVQNKEGREGYTRAGDFQITEQGLLMTADGNMVLGNQGPITIPPAQRITIGNDGTINAQLPGQPADALVAIDRLKLVNPPAKDLQKGQDGLFYSQGDGGAAADSNVRVLSGSLEGSNVNSVEQMVSMIDIQRNMDIQLKMVKALEDTADSSTSILSLPT